MLLQWAFSQSPQPADAALENGDRLAQAVTLVKKNRICPSVIWTENFRMITSCFALQLVVYRAQHPQLVARRRYFNSQARPHRVRRMADFRRAQFSICAASLHPTVLCSLTPDRPDNLHCECSTSDGKSQLPCSCQAANRTCPPSAQLWRMIIA